MRERLGRGLCRFAVLLAGLYCFIPHAVLAANLPPVPDERDRTVLEAFLLSLAQDKRFDFTPVSPSTNAHIVLHCRSHGGVNWRLNPVNLDGHSIPAELEDDLIRRNAKPGRHSPQIVPWSGLKWDSRIKVVDLLPLDAYSHSVFVRQYPQGRGWAMAHLPGYSQDGSMAVVQAGIGPWEHGATAIGILEKKDGRWKVIWWALTLYA